MDVQSFPLLSGTLQALVVSFSIAGLCTAQSTSPDLTKPGVIAGIDRSSTFNLGPTRLRGWLYAPTEGFEYAASSRISDASRQMPWLRKCRH